MKIEQTLFGEYENQPVYKYTMTNDHDVKASVLNLAGIWQEYSIPTANGHKNLLLSADSVNGFMGNGLCLNKAVGRVANRLDHGQFEIDGHTYQIEPNEGDNVLHGGAHTWMTYFWNVDTQVNTDDAQVILTQTFTEAEDGFPGTEKVKIVFTLANDNSVSIDYYGQTDQPTLFNPTQHTYWNISDEGDVTNLELQLNSTHHLAVDSGKIPTGEKVANANTPFDFSELSSLGDALTQMKATTTEGGFDDYFEVIPTDFNDPQPVAVLHDPKTKRTLRMYSDRNSVVMYTANGLGSDPDCGLTLPNKNWAGVALEGQTLTDAINHPGFGDTVLRPDQPMHNKLQFKAEF